MKEQKQQVIQILHRARSETGNVNISSSTSRKKNKKNGKIYIMK
jgi:hypothetical protein